MRIGKTGVLSVASIIVFGVAWELLWRTGYILHDFYSPSGIVQQGIQMVLDGTLLDNLGVTLYELGVAYALTLAVGIPMGLVLARVKFIRYLVDPYLTIMLSLPKVVLWPWILFILGLDIPSKITLGFVLGVFPTIVVVMNGGRTIDSIYVDVARGFDSSKVRLFTGVILPAALPSILAAARTAIGLCLVGVILGEVFGAFAGLGLLASQAGEVFDFRTVWVSALVLIAISQIASRLVNLVSRRVAPWAFGEHRRQ